MFPVHTVIIRYMLTMFPWRTRQKLGGHALNLNKLNLNKKYKKFALRRKNKGNLCIVLQVHTLDGDSEVKRLTWFIQQ